MTGTHVFILRDIQRKRTYAGCFSVTPCEDFIANLIFLDILENEECVAEREISLRKNLKHKTLRKKI